MTQDSRHEPSRRESEQTQNARNAEKSDEELIEAIRAGDKHAYQILVKRYLGKIWRLAVSILHNEAEAEDAVQDVFLSLWQSIGKWDPAGQARFSTWIYRVSFNKCIDIKRARKPTVSDDQAPEKATEENAYDHMLQNEISDKISVLLSELPETQRMAMLLYYYEELSVDEISAKLETSEQSVRSLLKRGRKALKEKIQYDPAFQSWDFPGDSRHLWR